MYKISIILLSLCSAKISLGQTDSNIPYQSLLNANPAFAGSNGGVRNQAFAQLPSKSGYRAYNFAMLSIVIYRL